MTDSETGNLFTLDEIQSQVDDGEKGAEGRKKRRRKQNPYPNLPLEEVLVVANAIQMYASGLKIRRLTLFQHLNKSPDSSVSRALLTNSNRYGITNGSYTAEWIELTETGKVATSPDSAPQHKARALFTLGIETIPVFLHLYNQLNGQRVPTEAVLFDMLRGYEDFEDGDIKKAIEIFLINCRFLNVISTVAGAERFTGIEAYADSVEVNKGDRNFKAQADIASATPSSIANAELATSASSRTDWGDVCFYITPIGADGSEARQHADLFMGSIVEPAISEFGLKLIRADKISEGGIITKQIMEYILKSRIVIADLSYHNPNAFYELAWRHATGKPTTQITRSIDAIPFDIGTIRTVIIDTTSIYSLVPKLDAYRTSIASQVRRALDEPDSLESPFLQYSNDLK